MDDDAEATLFVVAWLHRAADRLHEERGRLTELDAARGDADHGVNMDRGFGAIGADLRSAPAAGPGEALLRASNAVRRAVGGTSGPLWSVALRRMGKSWPAPPAPTLSSLAVAIRAGASGVAELGGAAPGDGTMLDALLPAADALEQAAETGLDLDEGLRLAAAAALDGAVATADFVASKGRASYLGARALGSPDPGAVSAAIVISALVPEAAE